MDIGFGQQNLHLLDEIVAKDVVGFGTAIDERLFGIAQLEELLTRQKQQSAGLEMKWEVTTLDLHISSDENTAVFTNEVTLQISNDRDPIKMYLRFSVVLEFEQHKWVVVHWHGSKPEQVESEKDTWGLDLWKAKADELEKLVAERTAELLVKNRELEIETALERVRAVAMGMKQAADMLSICQTISTELQKLGVEAIRNIQTAVIYKEKGTYTNYEFYTKHNKHLTTEVSYINHAMSKAFVKKMLEGPNEFYKRSLKGKKVQEWYAFQKKSTNQFADKYLAKASSLNYYWYSLGLVALGISTYEPLSKEEQDLFVRFRNVFELSYRRFLDIEQATAQAREAQIEAALEKVRSRSLAMHKADELLQVATVMRAEMAALGVEELETSSIYTMLDQETAECWYAIKDVRGQNSTLVFDEMTIDLKATQVGRQMLEFFNGNAPQTSILMKGEQRKEWINYCASRSNVLEGYYGQEIPERTYHLVKFSHGYVGAATPGAISTESWSLLHRIMGVFSMAYTRFLDLQKAEAQAREAQIEAALERVRSRSMAMHKSEELHQVINIVAEQITGLGVKYDGASFTKVNADKSWEQWIATPTQPYPFKVHIPYLDHPMVNSAIDAWRNDTDLIASEYSFEEKNRFFNHFFENTIAKNIPAERKKFVMQSKGLAISAVPTKSLLLSIYNYECVPFSNQENEVLKRFAKVFEQAYTRFLDLQKAEEQAREAQIQLGLERVRARTMAMQKQQDLFDVVNAFGEQLVALGLRVDYVSFINGTISKDRDWDLWGCNPNLKLPADHNFIPYKNTAYFTKTAESVDRYERTGYPIQVKTFNREEKDEFFDHYFSYAAPVPQEFKQFLYDAPGSTIVDAFLGEVTVSLCRYDLEPFTQEQLEIFKRFSIEFRQAYIRFLDLQKAEAQAREAQIEAALERVRSRSMAMHKSEELKEVIQLMFEQFRLLNFNIDSAQFDPNFKENDDLNLWAAAPGQPYSILLNIPYFDNPLFNSIKEAKNKGLSFISQQLSYEEKNQFFRHFFQHIKSIPAERQKLIFDSPGMYRAVVFMDNVSLAIQNYSNIPYTEEENEVLKRFGKTFEQVYTRFLDLQKAEAQAREAQIEAALERVRSKAMAMHNSSDLPSTAIIAFSELKKLGFVPIRGGISIQNKENRKNLLYSATSSDKADNLSVVGWATLDNHPILSEIYNQWLLGNDYYPSMKGKVLQAYYKQIQPTFNIPLQFPDEEQFGYFMHFTHGTFYGWCKQAVTEEEKKLLKRFAAVVDLTFKRFFDLQRAETQAREAQIEAALEKVRSRTMAMQSSEELADAAYVLFEQLRSLGVTHERINIGIVNEESQTIDFWITEQGGDKLNTKFSGRISEPTTLSKAYTAWKNGEKSLMIDLQGDALKSWLSYLNDEIKIPFNKAFLHDRRVQTAGFFSKGMLILTSPEPLQQEALYLLEKFAGVFDLTYTRFSDLKLAEAQALQAEKDLVEIKIARQKAEKALAELKSTQAQLIQSEKMASLGELTAGIAHEIQNPLNFVNNFSEVSAELVEEMNEELEKGDLEEVKYIASELKENLSKINHHGKRAGSIVKGMLEHSRKSEGKKELTDLNQLADECLRLSFHGLRAKDKTFQADFKTDFDPNLPKLEVVSQDIGRVLLNLINNAFYAVGERAKMHEADYKPIVTVSTTTTPLQGGRGVEISVKDNGSGIPEAIKDKIFQPFFTTKPTGSGTGLGLSLSYDIVKAHGGELKVETKVGEGLFAGQAGTVFIIKLPIH